MSVTQDEGFKLKKLVEHGCDPNLRNAEGKTLLHLKPLYTETFLSLGLRIDLVDNDGNTSIHLAVSKSHSCLASLLRNKSCTPAIINIRNREGLTAYHLSLVQAASIRKRLLDAGADSKMEMPKGQFRDKVVVMLREKDWMGEGYVLDDELIRSCRA